MFIRVPPGVAITDLVAAGGQGTPIEQAPQAPAPARKPLFRDTPRAL
jgi:hypothetical protein